MENDETTRLKQIVAQHPEELDVFVRNGLLSPQDAQALREQYPALTRAAFSDVKEEIPQDASFDEIIAALESEGCGDLAKELHEILYTE
jgi:hypothetical protein